MFKKKCVSVIVTSFKGSKYLANRFPKIFLESANDLLELSKK